MKPVLALLAPALLLAGCATVSPPQREATTRQVEPLSEGWSFRYDDRWTPETARAAPAGEWEAVTIPHTWNRLGEYKLGRTSATDSRQGKGWYRRTIDGTRLDPSRRHFLEFDAVGNVADVWLNGRHLARHAGAWTRFRVELDPALDFSGENVLVVRADNSDPQPGSTTEHVIPLLGDFFIHGGIYRPARMISVPASHIDLADFGGPGVYATPRVKDDGSARIEVLVRLAAPERGQALSLVLTDAGGREVARASAPATPGTEDARASLELPNPHLWDGRADPYLYRLTATLEGPRGVLDSVTQTIGIRSARFDPDEGFFLNGRHVALHGVSRHQDRLGEGWAITPEDNAQDMAMIAEMGANTVRVAHYPQAQQWFDLADSYGMVAWAEVPFVNRVSFGETGATPELTANARTQMTELIRQNFNHPSIVTWGIGNEVDLDLVLKKIGPKADPVPLLRELDALAHEEDPSRPTTLADCCEATPGEKPEGHQVLADIPDLVGYNRYYGWYYGKVGELGPHLDALHAAHPDLPISVSEYGVGGALTQHSNDPEGRPTDSGGRPQPEEFQSWWHEQTWPQIRARRYLWASWIWNMFDFASRVRKEGDATDINTKGLVSYERKVKKDAFFYYKAQWTSEPVLHITSRRFIERTDPVTRIKVYSNAPKVSLWLNERPLGDAECVDRVCTLDKVTLAPGSNRVRARADFASGPVEDRVEWRLAAE